MKKTLLAVAVAAALPAVAFAQTNVTLSGVFKTGLQQTKFSNGATGNGSATGFADGATRFVISGSEDLGKGLKAIFYVDNRFRVDDNSGSTGPLGTGAVFVGLEGGFGKVRTGKIDTYYLLGTDGHAAAATALEHWNVSLLSFVNSNSTPIARTSRSSNVLRYDTPNFNGLTGSVSWSPNAAGSEGVPGASSGQMYALDAAYNAGPLGLGAAYWNEKTENATSSGQKAWRLFGSYNLGMATVGLTYDESTVRVTGTDTKRAAFAIPVTAKLGPGTVMFTYTQAQDTKTAGNKNNNTGAKMIVLGYDYPLSKRTSLGVSYAVINNEAAASYGLFTGATLANLAGPVAGQDTKQLYLGVRHAF